MMWLFLNAAGCAVCGLSIYFRVVFRFLLPLSEANAFIATKARERPYDYKLMMIIYAYYYCSCSSSILIIKIIIIYKRSSCTCFITSSFIIINNTAK